MSGRRDRCSFEELIRRMLVAFVVIGLLIGSFLNVVIARVP